MNRILGRGIKLIAPVITLLLFYCYGIGLAEGPALTLRESIDTAIKNSVLLHGAKEGVKGAEALKNEAVTAFLPRFSTSYSYTRLHEQPSMTIPAIPPNPAITVPAGTRNNYNWAVEAVQPVFAGGAIWNNYLLNKQGLALSRKEEERTIQDTVQEVKVTYFNVLRAEKLLEAAKQAVELLKSHRNTAQQFFDVGLIPKNDLLYAEVELANSEHDLVRAENSLELAKASFNTALRRGISTPVQLEDILTETPFDLSFDECLKTALENRPELKAYQLKVDQAQSLLKIARSGYFPTVSLVGNYSKYGDDPDVSGSEFQDQESWYVMAVANWNFWEWGKTKFQVDNRLARENQTRDMLANATDQVTLEVKNAYLVVREAEKQIPVTKKAIEQAEENYRINKERYQEQVATSTEVLDAQTILTRAKSDYANALGIYHISQARLERAMGIVR
ncbi:MAG: TolC family protein [Deltaproteobacteria bacterium]|jgi:outer membrane protein TolC|nr:TolC family protein [Deltaproteobacteria bacterium]